MAVRKPIIDIQGYYFITFTCYQWLPLFQISDCYDLVYNEPDKIFSYAHSKLQDLTLCEVLP